MADRKRRRDTSPSTRVGLDSDVLASSPAPSSLPPSSPPPPFSDVDYRDEEEELAADAVQPEDLESEEDGEDLFGERMERDYRSNVLLDNYDPGDIDDEEYEELDITARQTVTMKLNRRDAEIARREGRVPAAFLDDLDDDGDEPLQAKRRHRKLYEADANMTMDDENVEAPEMTLDELGNVKTATITEWIAEPGPRRTIRREFKEFLLTYVDEHGTSVYGERIRDMGERNRESLEVSYTHLFESKLLLAYFLANSPASMLRVFDEVALEVTLIQFPEYARIHDEIHVRIADLPSVNTLRDLRQFQLNCLVKVSGVVSRRTGVFPQLKVVKYNCGKCGELLGPFYQDVQNEIKINTCPSCQSHGPFAVNMEQTIYRNYQKLTLQERPGSVPAGRLPRHREVVLLWDLIDLAKPGEDIEVTGIYRNNFDAALNTKNGFPVFATIIEANHIGKKEDLFASFRLTEDDQKQIRQLAKDERIGRRIIKSIAPSIYGHDDIKRALTLALFGGVPKNVNGKHPIRGDINVLMLGDPGTAKSQFLKYVEKTAHRSVFTTGQGASAVGLTASVRKDPVTREWTLEGGALVLADKGVCMIDEFDKMNDADRTSIHEAMEQQSISISKAGIVTTLQARCSIIAAANPVRGRYNPAIPFSQNVELTEPILSRFDILCVVKDTVDPTMDELLAKFVVNSHIRSHPFYNADQAMEDVVGSQAMAEEGDKDIIPQDLLRKYIMYAKEKVHPKLHQVDEDKLAKLYAELRRESMAGGSIPITVRHLESMIRMSEAHARMHLREYVRSDDVNMAIQTTVDSFISAQKYSVMKTLRKRFAKYVNYARDHDELLYFTLNTIVKEKVRFQQLKHKAAPGIIEIDLEDFESRVRDLDIHDVQPFFQSNLFLGNGFQIEREKGVIVKTF